MNQKIFVALLVTISVLYGLAALAVTTPAPTPSPTYQGVDLTIQKVSAIIVGIACWLISVAGVLIIIAIIFYGLKFLASQGDPKKVGDAKTALGWAIVGILVILGTYTIIRTVNNAVGGSASSITVLNCSGR